MIPPADTVRGRVSGYLFHHRELLKSPVLEIGARRPDVPDPGTYDFKRQLGFHGDWIGIDLQNGPGVDIVHDICNSPPPGKYRTAVCAEVLEHIAHPSWAVSNIWTSLTSNSWALFTVPFVHPLHSYPEDYWRATPMGLRVLLEDAGFVDIEVVSIGAVSVPLKQHTGMQMRSIPLHVAGRGRRP